MIPYRRILTLDGGGIKGVFAASFLSSLEQGLENSIGNYFDLISGTSTGAIIALALGLGLPVRDVLRLYEDLGQGVFRQDDVPHRFLHFFQRKYDSALLQSALTGIFGDHKIGDSRVRLVIPSLNLQNGTVHIYKTRHHPRFSSDYKEELVKVALASSAAPSYFSPQRSSAGIALVDGGMWANNPVAVAVVEAIGALGWDRNELRVLSVGCTQPTMDISGGSRHWSGKFYWASRIANVFLAGQSSGALGMAEWLAGTDNIYRIIETVAEGAFTLDGTKRIIDLRGLGAARARHESPRLLPVFFDEPAEAFVPFTS